MFILKTSTSQVDGWFSLMYLPQREDASVTLYSYKVTKLLASAKSVR